METTVRNREAHQADQERPWGRDGWPAWAAFVLQDQGMPPDEIHAVLATDDPDLVRTYLELHRERLEERLAAGLRTLRRIERSMPTVMLDVSNSITWMSHPGMNVTIDAEPHSTARLARSSIRVSHGTSPLRAGMRNHDSIDGASAPGSGVRKTRTKTCQTWTTRERR